MDNSLLQNEDTAWEAQAHRGPAGARSSAALLAMAFAVDRTGSSGDVETSARAPVDRDDSADAPGRGGRAGSPAGGSGAAVPRRVGRRPRPPPPTSGRGPPTRAWPRASVLTASSVSEDRRRADRAGRRASGRIRESADRGRAAPPRHERTRTSPGARSSAAPGAVGDPREMPVWTSSSGPIVGLEEPTRWTRHACRSSARCSNGSRPLRPGFCPAELHQAGQTSGARGAVLAVPWWCRHGRHGAARVTARGWPLMARTWLSSSGRVQAPDPGCRAPAVR